jgi:AcrR family transcriptional regulator
MSSYRSRGLGAVAELFERHGYDGVTIADVARAAGIARRTLYERFGSKAGLLAAIADAFCEEFALALTQDAGGDSPPFVE